MWMNHALVIVWILEVKGLGFFYLFFTQPFIFLEVDNCIVLEVFFLLRL